MQNFKRFFPTAAAGKQHQGLVVIEPIGLLPARS